MISEATLMIALIAISLITILILAICCYKRRKPSSSINSNRKSTSKAYLEIPD